MKKHLNNNKTLTQIDKYEVKQYTNQELEEKISKLKAETDEIISQQNEALSQKDKALSQKDKALSQKDETISQKDNRIKILEMFILNNGLIIP